MIAIRQELNFDFNDRNLLHPIMNLAKKIDEFAIFIFNCIIDLWPTCTNCEDDATEYHSAMSDQDSIAETEYLDFSDVADNQCPEDIQQELQTAIKAVLDFTHSKNFSNCINLYKEYKKIKQHPFEFIYAIATDKDLSNGFGALLQPQIKPYLLNGITLCYSIKFEGMNDVLNEYSKKNPEGVSSCKNRLTALVPEQLDTISDCFDTKNWEKLLGLFIKESSDPFGFGTEIEW